MFFHRRETYEHPGATPRRIAAAKRRAIETRKRWLRECEAVALFPELRPPEPVAPDPVQEIDKLKARFWVQEMRVRYELAQHWRIVRKRVRSHPQKWLILRAWSRGKCSEAGRPCGLQMLMDALLRDPLKLLLYEIDLERAKRMGSAAREVGEPITPEQAKKETKEEYFARLRRNRLAMEAKYPQLFITDEIQRHPAELDFPFRFAGEGTSELEQGWL